MKAKYALVVFILGWCFDVVGATLKIIHWYGARELFLIGMAFKVIGGLWLLYKIITYPKIKDFLNR